MKNVDKKISEMNTSCCKAKWYAKGKLDYRCENCDRDVTLQILFLHQAFSED